MVSAIFRDDLFFFELSGFLREVDRKRGREGGRGDADSREEGGGECCVGELASTGDMYFARVLTQICAHTHTLSFLPL